MCQWPKKRGFEMEEIPHNIPSVHLVNIKNKQILTATFLVAVFWKETVYPETSAHRKMEEVVQEYSSSRFSSLFYNPNSKVKQILEGKQKPHC